MNELAAFVAQYGLDIFLEHTHALLALIEKNGKVSAWNPALGSLVKQITSNNDLQDFLAQDSQEAYRELISSARKSEVSARETLGFATSKEDNPLRYDCVVIPLPDGRMLFTAELEVYDHELSDKYNNLLKLATQLKIDYDQVKKILATKQTELEAVIAQAHEVSHIDSLTYLPNRRQILNDLQHEVLRADRYNIPLSISMMDIDHFKNVNDTYGHAVGDDVLRQIANHLREHIRLPDIVGRYGGEEFLILLPNSDVNAAKEQAARLCQQIRSSTLTADGHPIQMTISMGIAQYSIGAESWQKLLNRADAALYQAKNDGRDTWAAADS